MSNYFSSYCDLISSREQLDYCQRASSLSDFLVRIKQLWDCISHSDQELLGEIARLNQTPIQLPVVNLAGIWLPYRYQPKRKLINWVIPIGQATEPFHDETISRYRQHLINQIIQPCTTSELALQLAEKLPNVEPAGFIFHLSRCGSTLVSGCLSELDSTCVFSEPPLLTELLLDTDLLSIQHQTFLRTLINFQAAAFSDRKDMIIKWNAWDIFKWGMIHELHPQTPAIFLVRNPEEILASHQRLAGRHMAGDPTMAHIHPAFSRVAADQNLLTWRGLVLGALFDEMIHLKQNAVVLPLDYLDLNVDGIQKICEHFGLAPDRDKFTQRMQYHSKSPSLSFSNDTQTKQNIFSNEDKKLIEHKLSGLYEQFLNSDFNSDIGRSPHA